MYFFQYIVRVTVLLHVLAMLNHALSVKSQKEQAFSDVLKNITLANKILQDLLKNYERLKKIYQSEELLQSDSSSYEIDQIPSKQNIQQKDRSYKEHTSSPYQGTAIYYASESVEKESEDSTKEEIKDETNEVNTKKPIKLHPNFVDDDKIVHKPVLNKNVADKNYMSSKFKTKGIETNYNLNKNNSSLEYIESDEVEQIVIDIGQDVSGIDEDIKDISDVSVATNAPHKKIEKSHSKEPIKNIMGKKTRFSIQHMAPKRIHRIILSGRPTGIKNNGSRIKKKVYSELFYPDKIWQEIIKKPVKLKKDKEQILRKSNQSIKNNKKITVLILTSNKKNNNIWKEGSKSNTKEDLFKFDLPKKIMRSDYGETCLQIPIRKCKKALQIVSKNICKRRYKCKSDFKSDFIQNSKDACNKEFAYREGTANVSSNKTKTTKENTEKIKPPEFRKKQLENFISLNNETPQDNFLRARKRRDKYEKKCQKESTKKCINACNYAIEETCSVHICERRIKKAIKSECKIECKKMYTDVKERIKSSSEFYSDSDSERDGDSDDYSDDDRDEDSDGDSD